MNSEALIQKTVEESIRKYIDSRKAMIPGFVEQYFSFKGSLKLHRKAFGADLFKVPINVFWSIPLFLIKTTAATLKVMGVGRLSERLNRIPAGLHTRVQEEINWLIYTRLLALPYRQGHRESVYDALLVEILSHPDLATLFADYLEVIARRSNDNHFRRRMEDNLAAYATGRVAVADLTNSIIAMAAGYAAFHKTTPGVFAGGSAAATAIAQQLAISNFWLGSTIGSWYYGIFPATASTVRAGRSGAISISSSCRECPAR